MGSFSEIALKWAPTEEQGRYVVVYHVGNSAGVILSNVIIGYMIYYFNWKVVYFTVGNNRAMPDSDHFYSFEV